MPKKASSIPVNSLIDGENTGIYVERLSMNDSRFFEEAEHAHRHDFHFFLIQEEGSTSIEIDFQKFHIGTRSVAYIHPSQVHRVASFEQGYISVLLINNDSLNQEQLKLLEEISPAAPLALDIQAFSIISESVSLCLKLAERKQDKLFRSLVKGSCNVLVTLIISQFLEHAIPTDMNLRYVIVAKEFRSELAHNFHVLKRPAEYAKKLHLSTAYLNECVKSATGKPVSYHIHQRVVLEAKRLLYHSDKSVKEIAAILGYDDYPYFSRLFTKTAGMSALSFRRLNRE